MDLNNEEDLKNKEDLHIAGRHTALDKFRFAAFLKVLNFPLLYFSSFYFYSFNVNVNGSVQVKGPIL